MTFQLQRMATPSKDKIIADIRRVDQILNKSILTSKDYHKHSTISHGTLRKYLGSWHEALCEAGLEYKSNRKVKTKKLTEQPGKFLTDEKIIEELKHVAQKLDRDTLTTKDVDNHSTIISASTIRKRFGWKEGLGRAGLKIKPLGKRYSNEECFENLVNVWTHYGRQPKAYEMKQYPSVVGSKAYSARWGSWLEALEAFTEEINKSTVPLEEEISVQPAGEVEKRIQQKIKQEDKRDIPYRLRYRILSRDSFRCVFCGNSPAKDPTCELHIDHRHPFSKGGKTVFDNLQTLCMKCNLGKSNLL